MASLFSQEKKKRGKKIDLNETRRERVVVEIFLSIHSISSRFSSTLYQITLFRFLPSPFLSCCGLLIRLVRTTHRERRRFVRRGTRMMIQRLVSLTKLVLLVVQLSFCSYSWERGMPFSFNLSGIKRNKEGRRG